MMSIKEQQFEKEMNFTHRVGDNKTRDELHPWTTKLTPNSNYCVFPRGKILLLIAAK